MRRAKIVATIGPVSDSPEMIGRLIKAGMNVARLNFSHGSHEFYAEVIRNIRETSAGMGIPVAILQDLQGPKIRTGPLKGGRTVTLEPGRTLTITSVPVEGSAQEVSTSYANLPRDVTVGERLLISDGRLELEVIAISEERIECLILTGGELREHQGINAPGSEISAASLTEKDVADIRFGIDHRVDYAALSFVRQAQDVLDLKEIIEKARADIPVIAKLETPRAIEELHAILDVCDGVMVARGDLGVEVPPERVPPLQKRIIRAANRQGKPVITATQMLESMIHNPRPTRAEASDVANAVLDGSDAVMLSAETATGAYPVESVSIMDKIIREAETAGISGMDADAPEGGLSFPDAICEAAFSVSQSLPIRAICAFTQSGSTARMIAKYRPGSGILGISPRTDIMHRMCLYWGVEPLVMDEINNVDELIQRLERLLVDRNLAAPGDNLIILTGAPIVEKGNTSLMKLHEVRGHLNPGI